MKTAIDRYARGKQKEANAEDYAKFYSAMKGRFLCPECGEPVYLSTSKLNSNFFAHYKKSEISAECERRVDVQVDESIYEMVGLPLFIRNDGEKFALYIGFKAIPNQIMQTAIKEKASLQIGNSQNYLINYERFSNERSTLLEVDFVPPSGQSYRIKYSNVSNCQLIRKYWADYAEGFLYGGSLFSVTTLGGRKIRKGEAIACDEEYYWVRRQPSLPSLVKGIDMKQVGTMTYNKLKYYVFRGLFSSQIADYEFEHLAEELRNQVGVLLLDQRPEFKPLWPPMLRCDDGFYASNNVSRIWGNVKSGNDTPKMFIYNNAIATPISIECSEEVVDIPLAGSATVVNIDRKRTSGGIQINRGKYNLICEKTEFFIDGEELVHGNKLVLNEDKVIVCTNLKCTYIICEKNQKFQMGTISGTKVFYYIDSIEEIFLIVSGQIVGTFIFNLEAFAPEGVYCQRMTVELKGNAGDRMVFLPYEVRKRITNGDITISEMDKKQLLKTGLISVFNLARLSELL